MPADSPRTLAAIFLTRIALNYQFRFVYPFLPAIGRGLGVELPTVGLLLTVRAMVGATAPLYGLLADRLGRRRLMFAGLFALVIGATMTALTSSLAGALIAFGVLGLAKASYDPAALAYVGDAVPYERRGRVLGLLELPWALSWLIGVPVAGFLIAGLSWRAPFWLAVVAGVLGLIGTWRFCPPDHGRSPVIRASWRMAGQPGTRPPWRRILPIVSLSLLLIAASDNVFVVYGAWLETEFGLAVTAVGLASTVMALADFTAEGSAAALVDRLGKRRAALGGLLLNLVAYLLLPHVSSTLPGALAGTAFMFLTFEFTMVCLMPLVSEAAPEARGLAMSLNTSAMAFGRVISSLSGPRLWALGGLQLNATVSIAIVALAGLILWHIVDEHG